MRRVDLVVVGASRGGTEALRELLSRLPARFAPPLVIALHRHTGPSQLCEQLAAHSVLPLVEVSDHQVLDQGHAYLAPSDYHVIVERGVLRLSTEARVMYARPSIDVLFESAAYSYRAGVVGVVMTGASDDGAAGAAEIHRRGGRVIVQEPTTAVSPVAPRAALARVEAAWVADVHGLAQWLGEHCHRNVDPVAGPTGAPKS